MKQEHKTPEYLKLNPNGLVPTMVDGEFVLYESHAIMRYLSMTRKVEDHWYPSEPKARAEVDRYLDWHHGNLRQGITFWVHRIMEGILG